MNSDSVSVSWTHSERLNEIYDAGFANETFAPSPSARETIRTHELRAKLSEVLDEILIYLKASEGTGNKDALGACLRTLRASTDILKLFQKSFRDVPVPDFMLLEEGGLGLEWYKQKGKVFTLTDRANAELIFAALLGSGETSHGKIPLDKEESVRDLAERIKHFCSPDRPDNDTFGFC